MHHRWRIVVGLVVALLCILLAAHLAQARQTEPSGKGAENTFRRPPGDDDVVVRPKVPTSVVGKGDKLGFDWIIKGAILEEGKPGEFRCDLHERLTKLVACKKNETTCRKAYAVKFKVDKLEFWVAEKNGGYDWKIPNTHVQTSCDKKGKNCSASGIPHEFMVGDTAGTIEAKFSSTSKWEAVEEVWMKGKSCD